MRALFVLLALSVPLAACRQDETLSAYAGQGSTWQLTAIDDAPVAAGAAATISFPAEGRIAGTGPCNRFTASQSAPYPWFSLTGLAATRTACPALDAETAFFRALAMMAFAEVQGDVLILSAEGGRSLRFARLQD
jgi:heat shock protein HslJ